MHEKIIFIKNVIFFVCLLALAGVTALTGFLFLVFLVTVFAVSVLILLDSL